MVSPLYEKHKAALQEKGLSKEEFLKREKDFWEVLYTARDDRLKTVLQTIMTMNPGIDDAQAHFFWVENRDRLILGFDMEGIEDADG